MAEAMKDRWRTRSDEETKEVMKSYGEFKEGWKGPLWNLRRVGKVTLDDRKDFHTKMKKEADWYAKNAASPRAKAYGKRVEKAAARYFDKHLKDK